MKSLSIRQPWASLIIASYKNIENRSRISHYRGQLLIHAGKSWDLEGEMWIKDKFDPGKYSGIFGVIDRCRGLRGGVIGSVCMTDCVTEYESEWFSGPYGYVFEDPRGMHFKPHKGQLGFFNIPMVNLFGKEI